MVNVEINCYAADGELLATRQMGLTNECYDSAVWMTEEDKKMLISSLLGIEVAKIGTVSMVAIEEM